MSCVRRITVVASLLAGVMAAWSALAGGQPPAVTSSIDGKTVLPQQSRWLAYPNLAPAQIDEVDFLIDGKLRWVEHRAPYNYGGDDQHGHLGYLYTSWLSPGKHQFTARVKTKTGETATDEVTARVLPAPAPPAALAGTWTRMLTPQDQAKSDPRYAGAPPIGRWRLVIDRVGIWELDPVGTGIVSAYSVSGNVPPLLRAHPDGSYREGRPRGNRAVRAACRRRGRGRLQRGRPVRHLPLVRVRERSHRDGKPRALRPATRGVRGNLDAHPLTST